MADTELLLSGPNLLSSPRIDELTTKPEYIIKNCIFLPHANQTEPMFTFGTNGYCVGINLIGYKIVPLDSNDKTE